MVVLDLLIAIVSYQKVWINYKKNLDEDGFKILKKEFPDKRQYLNKELAYPYEYFNKIDDYKKLLMI